METNIFLRIDDETKEESFASIEKAKALGKLHKKANLSSLIRDLLRAYNKKVAKW